ncbi:MAG: helix-turn-helix transcriptional regulator [Terriglobia bacterium]
MGFRLHNCSFHGKLIKAQELSGIRLTEIVYCPNTQTARHSHEYAYVGVTLSGRSHQVCGAKVRSSQAWTVMYHPAGEVHSDHFQEGGARELNIEIAPLRLVNLGDGCPYRERPVHVDGGTPGWLAARLYSEFRLMDELSSMAIEGLTIELMAEVFRQHSRVARFPAWLRQARELIHDRFAERLTLRGLAETAGVHPVHLAREFRRHTGLTVGQQVRQLRIERACQLLSSDRCSLAQVALLTGFSDQSQFSKTFRHAMGMTPSEYRHLKFPGD